VERVRPEYPEKARSREIQGTVMRRAAISSAPMTRLRSGKRIDVTAQCLQTDDKASGSWTKDDKFIMTGINFPITGCCQITGRYNDYELPSVVWFHQSSLVLGETSRLTY
jgi:hypothetical protein